MNWAVMPGLVAWVVLTVIAGRWLLGKIESREELDWKIGPLLEIAVSVWGLAGLALFTLLFGVKAPW